MERILTLGASAWTTIFRVDAALPNTSAKLIPNEAIQLGDGMSSSAACAIAALGGQASWWGRVGDDANGRAAMASLASAGIDVTNVKFVSGVHGSFCTVIVDNRGERLVVPRHDPTMPTDASWLPLHRIKEFSALLTEVRWPEGAAAGLDAARMAGIPAVLDAEVAVPGALDMLCSKATHILFSETGLAHYVGSAQPQLALQAAQRKAPHAFVGVTLGERGFYWLENNTLMHEPGLTVNAVDTLGAGDVFHGAYVLAMVEGMSAREAARFACVAASLKCETFGGRLGAPSREAVNLRANLKNLPLASQEVF
jgi:sulfofructose kinase